LARLHSIKETGFNEEDATQVNDVAKALAAVNIQLFDEQGNWIAVSDIFDQLAGKWADLDDKTRAYVTTTLAGTLQQNKLITLMSDMSKGIDGGSRAYELYEGAMNSAGIASEKYAIYQESIQAAHDKMIASLENLYSVLARSEVIKGFYNSMSGLANSVASVTQATKGFNVAIPVIIGVVLSLVVAIKKATLAWQAYKTAQTTAVAATAFSNIGFSPIIAGVAALAVVVSLLADVFKKSEQSTIDYSKQLEYLRDQSSKLTPLVDEYKDLASKAVITTDEHKKMKSILDDIVEVAPYLKDSITNSTGAYKDQTQVLATLNAELEKNVINQRNATDWQSISAVNNEQFSKDLAKYSQTLEDVPDVVSVLGLDNINLGDVERAKKTIKKR
jgi:hypothetical protein